MVTRLTVMTITTLLIMEKERKAMRLQTRGIHYAPRCRRPSNGMGELSDSSSVMLWTDDGFTCFSSSNFYKEENKAHVHGMEGHAFTMGNEYIMVNEVIYYLERTGDSWN